MAVATTANSKEGQLVAEVTCPNCWHRFPPDQILFIARHDSLIGDDIAGPSAYRRFLPARFNVAGDAIDSRGVVCQQLACPRCHLEIARPLVEMLPFFTSIVGAPASGKSYFLAAMTHQMRLQASRFGFSITDGDPTANYELQRYEEMMFLNPNPEQPIALRKTELHGTELYQSIVLDGQRQTFPRPFQFTITPTSAPRGSQDPALLSRSIVLYDNAGEHFQPGQDTTAAPVTLHLAEAASIFFVFDPTQDARFRQRCESDDPQLKHGNRPGSQTVVTRQEIILNEMASRVRRYKGMAQTARHPRPLIIILAKADIWRGLLGRDIEHEPLIDERGALDLRAIQATSESCQQLMIETCPEIVAAAKAFSSRIFFVPVSSLGTSPELVVQGDKRFYGIRPSNIRPKWVAVPMLLALALGVPGLIPTA